MRRRSTLLSLVIGVGLVAFISMMSFPFILFTYAKEQTDPRFTLSGPDNRARMERIAEAARAEEAGEPFDMEQALRDERALIDDLAARGIDVTRGEQILRQQRAKTQSGMPAPRSVEEPVLPPVPAIHQAPLFPLLAALGCGGGVVVLGLFGSMMLLAGSREE